jgi:hypothetical protein
MEWAIALVSAAFAAGGAWVAVHVELRYLRRDVDAVIRRVNGLESLLLQKRVRV